jgi:predicted aspartyl protease
MAMLFKYRHIPRTDGTLHRAPCIPVYERDAQGRVLEILALVDSGADTTVVPKKLADALGLQLGEESETGGIGGKVKARKATFPFMVRKGREWHTLTIPALVLMDEAVNIPVLLGRNGFFEQFDITFRQAQEKIVLKKAASA